MTELEKRAIVVKPELVDTNESSAPVKLLKCVIDATRKHLQGNAADTGGANYKTSGILAADAAAKGLTAATQYSEPVDKSSPPANANQRLYTFENHDDIQNTIRLDLQSFYTVGSGKVADIPVKHPSVAAVHAVFQYRKVDGIVKLYLIDLNAPAGVLVNGKRVPSEKYVELLNEDVIQLGSSQTEFIFINGST